MKKLVMLIPAFNEEQTIGRVIASIPKIKGLSTIVLVVNDGSTDKTAAVAKKSGALVVSHERNLGVGQAFQSGLEQCLDLKTDYMVNIDADGQFNPTDIPKLIQPLLKDRADFVAADRFYDPLTGSNRRPQNMPESKYYGNLLMAKLISFLAGQEFNDVSCGFRAYNRKALLSLNLLGGFTYTQESFLDFATKGIRIATIPLTVKYFQDRKSRVADNLLHYAFKTMKIIVRAFRDYRPMILFYYLSIVPTLIAFLSGSFSLIHYVSTGLFTPYKWLVFLFVYTSTLSLILLLSGFIGDMFVRVRKNQERILFLLKNSKFS